MIKAAQNYLLIYAGIIALLVSALFSIKNDVIKKTSDLKLLNNYLFQISSNISILEAEFTYLSRPERIVVLQKKYLNVRELNKDQIEILEIE